MLVRRSPDHHRHLTARQGQNRSRPVQVHLYRHPVLPPLVHLPLGREVQVNLKVGRLVPVHQQVLVQVFLNLKARQLLVANQLVSQLAHLKADLVLHLLPLAHQPLIVRLNPGLAQPVVQDHPLHPKVLRHLRLNHLVPLFHHLEALVRQPASPSQLAHLIAHPNHFRHQPVPVHRQVFRFLNL